MVRVTLEIVVGYNVVEMQIIESIKKYVVILRIIVPHHFYLVKLIKITTNPLFISEVRLLEKL